MAFGRRKRDQPSGDDGQEPDDSAPAHGGATTGDDAEPSDAGPSDAGSFDAGPFDIEDFDDPAAATAGRHDLGAVLLPAGDAELAVEVSPQGVPAMVWMVTPHGRYNVTAYAAPKTGSLWRDVITEIGESLRSEGARVSFEDGPWGREIVGVLTNGPEPVVMRFIGADGYRWMLRVATHSSPDGAASIADDARKALADTVIRRGDTPYPVRFMLPLQLSESLIARLRARAEQVVAEHVEDEVAPPEAQLPPEVQPVARRSEQGSAMQQLRSITGG